MRHALLSRVETARNEADDLVEVQKDLKNEVEPAYVSATSVTRTGSTHSMSATRLILCSASALATVKGPSVAETGRGLERRGMAAERKR